MTLFTDTLSGLWNPSWLHLHGESASQHWPTLRGARASRSGRGLEEAGACDEEEEDNRLVILPTLGFLTRLRQQNVFMAPRSPTEPSAPCCPPEVRWRRYNSHSQRGTAADVPSPRETRENKQQGQSVAGQHRAPPPSLQRPLPLHTVIAGGGVNRNRPGGGRRANRAPSDARLIKN